MAYKTPGKLSYAQVDARYREVICGHPTGQLWRRTEVAGLLVQVMIAGKANEKQTTELLETLHERMQERFALPAVADHASAHEDEKRQWNAAAKETGFWLRFYLDEVGRTSLGVTGRDVAICLPQPYDSTGWSHLFGCVVREASRPGRSVTGDRTAQWVRKTAEGIAGGQFKRSYKDFDPDTFPTVTTPPKPETPRSMAGIALGI